VRHGGRGHVAGCIARRDGAGAGCRWPSVGLGWKRVAPAVRRRVGARSRSPHRRPEAVKDMHTLAHFPVETRHALLSAIRVFGTSEKSKLSCLYWYSIEGIVAHADMQDVRAWLEAFHTISQSPLAGYHPSSTTRIQTYTHVQRSVKDLGFLIFLLQFEGRSFQGCYPYTSAPLAHISRGR